MNKTWDDFNNIWVIDYEFNGSNNGNVQNPICYAARNLLTNETIAHWIDGTETEPLYSTGEDTLIVAFFASAEMGCHIPLNFKIPLFIFDLYTEFRNLTNGLKLGVKNSLIGACMCYDIPCINATKKELMRNRILQGEPFTNQEKKDILQYCSEDVDMTAKLYYPIKKSMEKKGISLQYALLRGRFMSAIAHMEYYGVPVDTKKFNELLDCWDIIKEELIFQMDKDYNIYDGTTFKVKKFHNYLVKHSIPWEYTPTGQPRTDQKLMADKAKIFPQLKSLQELLKAMGQLRQNKFQIGTDRRNRSLLNPFSSKTSRGYPQSSKFLFANATWLRSYIKPEKGMAISYIDYEQQEIAIAAVLSQDKNMIKAYNTGDCHMAFAITAGAVPTNATKKTHPKERELYKTTLHAIDYGQGYFSLAQNIGVSPAEGKRLLDTHKKAYPQYWKWLENFIDVALLSKEVRTRYNWQMQTKNTQYRTLLNWPMQATGAEILRLAICLCIDRGIRVIAPVHDAILIEDTIENINASIKKAKQCMGDASEYVLGLRIRTDVKTFKYPERYRDPRGQKMWETVDNLIENINPAEKKARLEAKILDESPLDKWVEKPTEKQKPIRSKKMEQQHKMKPQSLTEKETARRIKKASGLSHIEIMHLINLARDTDFDLEHEVDWQHESYDIAKKRIQQRRTMKDFHGDS